MGKAIEKKMEIDRNEKKKTYRQKIEKREQKRKKIKDWDKKTEAVDQGPVMRYIWQKNEDRPHQ